jgi:lysozyme
LITDILSQLERDEGRRGSAYQDYLGYWTIAIGVCIDARKGCKLTDDEINYLTNNRVTLAMKAILQTWPWSAALDPVRFGVLQNMVYQMGIDGVAQFKNFLAAFESGDYAGASAHGLDSLWAKEQSPARAQRLMNQLTTGEWQ